MFELIGSSEVVRNDSILDVKVYLKFITQTLARWLILFATKSGAIELLLRPGNFAHYSRAVIHRVVAVVVVVVVARIII